ELLRRSNPLGDVLVLGFNHSSFDRTGGVDISSNIKGLCGRRRSDAYLSKAGDSHSFSSMATAIQDRAKNQRAIFGSIRRIFPNTCNITSRNYVAIASLDAKHET